MDVGTLKRIPHPKRIHHSCQHAHVIAGDPVESGSVQSRTAKKITTADNQPDLHTNADQLTNFKSSAVQYPRINAYTFDTERFPGQFEQDTLILGSRFGMRHRIGSLTRSALATQLLLHLGCKVVIVLIDTLANFQANESIDTGSFILK